MKVAERFVSIEEYEKLKSLSEESILEAVGADKVRIFIFNKEDLPKGDLPRSMIVEGRC